ncbi:MAG: hypothetical protein CL678_18515 [Bdellovibrionaceae bacterium]|nr:hypothetical protein [Pseudobdellovibrionaceae bacterium]
MRERRDRVFMILAAVFWGAITLLNVIGITRFIEVGPLSLAVGVLPYPLTFLCTDLISEFYGKKRANFVVWVGLGLNLFSIFFLWLGHIAPPVDVSTQPPWQVLSIADSFFLPTGEVVEKEIELFSIIYACTASSVTASMVAYITAQFCDVKLFHVLKKLTHGKKLWLRNNGSTLVSQLVDSVMVVAVTFGGVYLRGDMSFEIISTLLISNYLFKMVAALLDTIPFYFLVYRLKKYLQIESMVD